LNTTTDVSTKPVTFTGAATIDVNGHTVNFANGIGNSGGGGLTVQSSAPNGVLSLSGANTYTGNTTVSSGTLLVNGSTGIGTVTVSSGAILGGTGTIGSNVVLNSGAVALLTNGATLTISGKLTLNNNTVDLNLPSNLAAGTYTLATYLAAGSSGSFNSTPVILSGSIASGDVATVTTSGGTVSLVVASSVNTDPATAGFSFTQNGNSLQFSWAPDHLGWQLYTNSIDLSNTNDWFPLAGSASVTNENITVDPTKVNVFFQLRYP
jgi:autotransporter-associated beta strand protein